MVQCLGLRVFASGLGIEGFKLVLAELKEPC